ncbi:MAG: cell division protein FtsW [Thermotogota bacterium]|nr:cell division protein FtsW [Thermotogota bacterium]MDK2864692.1 cell division protein FtsW [Thermotogota bacterium]
MKDLAGLLLYVLLMLMLGIVALYGADILISTTYHVELSFVKKQLLWIALGLAGFLITALMDFKIHRNLAPVYLLAAVITLLIVFRFPPIGNSHRWINLKSFTIQPSEFAKIVILILLARYIEHAKDKMTSFIRGLIIPLLMVSPIVILTAIEPDLSTSVLMFTVIILLLYVAGTRFWHILTLMSGLALIAMASFKIGILKPYQMERLKSFVDLWTGGHPYQQELGRMAFATGGIFGSGPGLGTIKRYIPVRESDFIFSVFGEEFGVIGILLVFVLLLGLVNMLFKVASRYVESAFGRYYIYGFGILIAVQSLVNIGVNVGLLPPTGVPLPLVSYGGSSMIATLTGFGIAISIVTGEQRG